MNKEQTSKSILDFAKAWGTELPFDDPSLEKFLGHTLDYLSASETVQDFREQNRRITGSLIPVEQETGRFRFVLDHNLDPKRGKTLPTIQITGTSGNFHAIIITKQETSPNNYGGLQISHDRIQTNIEYKGQAYQIGLALNRIRPSVDWSDYPALYNMKVSNKAYQRPIIFFLGPIRQSPNPLNPEACIVSSYTKSINSAFSILEERFGDNLVIGTCGWEGAKENTRGVPREVHRRATEANKIILTTTPEVGEHDCYPHSTVHVPCGKDWGDDSAAVAAVCDAAVIVGPCNTWVQIEIENLLAQNKPFVVIDNAGKPLLKAGESSRIMTTLRGSYTIYADATVAAQALLEKLPEADFTSSSHPPLILARPALLSAALPQ